MSDLGRERVQSDKDPYQAIDPQHFRRLGLLQEVNRLLLHPLGFALFITVDAANHGLGLGIAKTEDPEGFAFEELIPSDEERADRIAEEWERRAEVRRARMGYVIQPFVSGRKGDWLQQSDR